MSLFDAIYDSVATPMMMDFHGDDAVVTLHYAKGTTQADVSCMTRDERTSERVDSGTGELSRVREKEFYIPRSGNDWNGSDEFRVFDLLEWNGQKWSFSQVLSRNRHYVKVLVERPEVAEVSRPGYRRSV